MVMASGRDFHPIGWRTPVFLLVLNPWWAAGSLAASTLHVPQDHQTIQAALNAAEAGDTVLVSAGTYKERIRLVRGVTLKSAGDDTPGALGLKRAETTIIDGNVNGGKGAGVTMAEGCTLDGFTITGVGTYDEVLWNKHHATQGEEQPHEHIGEPGTAGIAIIGVEQCTVTNNIVHHIGYTGIAIQGADGKRVSPHVVKNIAYRNMGGGIGSMKKSTALIEGNRCFENYYAGIGHDNASPIVLNNLCYANIRAGIGISEGSCPIVRGNQCYKNRRAGIGIRTGAETQPIVEHNECFENDMAGIGNEEHARPILRHNRCYKNQMAGIGSRSGAQPVIVDNECFENKLAGIGSREGAAPVICRNRSYKNQEAGIGNESAARSLIVDNEVRENQAAGIGVRGSETLAVIVGNRCLENRLVAIGLPDGATGYLHGNELVRTGGGAPPLVAVKGGSTGLLSHNLIRGGGVAGVLVQGTAELNGNEFQGKGPGQGSAVWVWKDSRVALTNNRFRGFRNALNASESQVTAIDNLIHEFEGSAILVRKPSLPNHVAGNVAVSSDPKAQVIQGDKHGDVTRENVLKKPEDFDESQYPKPTQWPQLSRETDESRKRNPQQ